MVHSPPPAVLDWLLERDDENPSVRYFTLTELLDLPPDGREARKAQEQIMVSGPVPAILDAQHPPGFWVKEGGGYSPKYRSTVWQILFLAELGADADDDRVRRGCAYVLDHSLAANGAFAAGQNPHPSGAIHCLNGNLLVALIRLGWWQDMRVQKAISWLAGSILGRPEIAYGRWGVCGPGFACGRNDALPCAWGANKAVRALLSVPPGQRSADVGAALSTGAEFLLSHDPSLADYPNPGKVSRTWFRLGFPLTYWSDVLETLQNLADLGLGQDPRVQAAITLIRSKQDRTGRWSLENSLSGKMWQDSERPGKPSKWITLRALRALQRADGR